MGLALVTGLSRLVEELIQQFVATDTEVLGYIGEDPRQSAGP